MSQNWPFNQGGSPIYRANNAPEELRLTNQWAPWRLAPNPRNPGKKKKLPHNPHSPSCMASSNDASSWGSFGAAFTAGIQYGFYGLGFCFFAHDDFAGVDLDECRNPDTGIVQDWARRIILAFHSYAEVSPSGRGVKIFIRGKLPGAGRRCQGPLNIELYDQGRFFTVTGLKLQGMPPRVEARQEELDRLYAHVASRAQIKPPYMAETPRPLQGVPSILRTGLSDLEVVSYAHAARNGCRFHELWDGGGDGGDPSSGDLALCNLLAFWTRMDPEQIDRLFRQSGRMRPKWDARRGEGTYGAQTIEKAIATCTRVYEPAVKEGNRS